MTADVDLVVDQVGQFVHQIVDFHESIYPEVAPEGIEPSYLPCRGSTLPLSYGAGGGWEVRTPFIPPYEDGALPLMLTHRNWSGRPASNRHILASKASRRPLVTTPWVTRTRVALAFPA